MCLHGAAHGAHRERHLKHALQVASGGLPPPCERPVCASQRCVAVGACLDGPCIVAGGEEDTDYAVHDTLVVGRGPVGVRSREGVSLYYPVDCFVSDDLPGHGAVDTDHSLRGEVTKYTHVNPAAGERLHGWRKQLAYGVHQVRAHGVPYIHEDLDDEHLAGLRVQTSGPEVNSLPGS